MRSSTGQKRVCWPENCQPLPHYTALQRDDSSTKRLFAAPPPPAPERSSVFFASANHNLERRGEVPSQGISRKQQSAGPTKTQRTPFCLMLTTTSTNGFLPSKATPTSLPSPHRVCLSSPPSQATRLSLGSPLRCHVGFTWKIYGQPRPRRWLPLTAEYTGPTKKTLE